MFVLFQSEQHKKLLVFLSTVSRIHEPNKNNDSSTAANLPLNAESAVVVRWHHCGSLSLVGTVEKGVAGDQMPYFYLKRCFVTNLTVESSRIFWNIGSFIWSFGET